MKGTELALVGLALSACEFDVDHKIDADITHHLDFGQCEATCESIREELQAVGITGVAVKETEDGYEVTFEGGKIPCKPQ